MGKGGGEWCVYVCSPSLDQSLVDDAPEELSGDLQLLVRKLGEELVLVKHVLEHTSEHLLQREWRGGPGWRTGWETGSRDGVGDRTGGSHRYIHTVTIATTILTLSLLLAEPLNCFSVCRSWSTVMLPW